MMLLEQSLQAERSEFIQSQLHLGEEEELSPPTLSHPRLAMLDTATVLQLTSQPNLSSVKASTPPTVHKINNNCTYIVVQALFMLCKCLSITTVLCLKC